MSSVQVLREFVRTQHSLKGSLLLVALQGPQGSGKSFLSAQLEQELATGPSPLRAVVLSIDDLYLPHEGLVSLAAEHPHNHLLQGRGQPGTHDVQLGLQLLASLKAGTSQVHLPRFDKSRFNGEGDRLPMERSPVVQQPPRIDVVILEGWCVGFRPSSRPEIDGKWAIWEEERAKLQIADGLCTENDIIEINEKLQEYEALWDMFDVAIQLRLPPSIPEGQSPYHIIYEWRLEQEHRMKALNGGTGMSDEVIKAFVDRYIPGYVFFGTVLRVPTEYQPSPLAHVTLTLTLDSQRQLLSTTQT